MAESIEEALSGQVVLSRGDFSPGKASGPAYELQLVFCEAPTATGAAPGAGWSVRGVRRAAPPKQVPVGRGMGVPSRLRAGSVHCCLSVSVWGGVIGGRDDWLIRNRIRV